MTVLSDAATISCGHCGHGVDRLRHIHDCAHGIEGTHMVGSERYECMDCGRSIYKEEGKKQGLRFVLD